jgi:exopolysaccharide production protein ExoY
MGFIDTGLPPSSTARGQLSQLDAILHDDRIDTVVLCGQITERRFARVVRAATAAECHVLSLTRSFAVAGMQPAVQWHRGVPLVELRAPVLRGQQMFLKRAMDVCVSAAALAALSPVIAILAALIRMETPGSVFFAQRRLGRHGRVFHCFKFRSMYCDAEERLRGDAQLYDLYLANDYKLPEELDTRITRLGRILRRTSLDELPQLFNVLRGDMSLVGPRPIVPDEIKHYYHEGPLFLSLKPGLTGAWQVNGRSGVSYPERARLELEYVQSWSLARDIEILLRTVPAVLFQQGAH